MGCRQTRIFSLAGELASLVEESTRVDDSKPRSRMELKRSLELRFKKRVKEQYTDGKSNDLLKKVIAICEGLKLFWTLMTVSGLTPMFPLQKEMAVLRLILSQKSSLVGCLMSLPIRSRLRLEINQRRSNSGLCLLSLTRVVSESRPCNCFVAGCSMAAPAVYTLHVMERHKFPGWKTGFSVSIPSSLNGRRIGLCKKHLRDLYIGQITLQAIDFGAWR